MAKKKKEIKKLEKRQKKEEDEEESGGTSLDDAFSDDSDVEYAESKPRKIKKKSKEEMEDEIEDAEERAENVGRAMNGGGEVEHASVKASKPVGKIKKGDKVKVDNLNLEVDVQIVLMDHGTTKEMAIEVFNPKTDIDYQLRYFSDQVESTMEFYELADGIMYVKRSAKIVSW